jgi:hypothetical protein
VAGDVSTHWTTSFPQNADIRDAVARGRRPPRLGPLIEGTRAERGRQSRRGTSLWEATREADRTQNASFEMLHRLLRRPSVMLCPRCIDIRSQPAAAG